MSEDTCSTNVLTVPTDIIVPTEEDGVTTFTATVNTNAYFVAEVKKPIPSVVSVHERNGGRLYFEGGLWIEPETDVKEDWIKISSTDIRDFIWYRNTVLLPAQITKVTGLLPELADLIARMVVNDDTSSGCPLCKEKSEFI